MFSLIRLLGSSVAACVRSRTALAAEILALRHQLLVLERSRRARLPLTAWDRALWALVLRRWSGWKHSLTLVKPETVIAWHRRSFRLFWRWKSRGGRLATHAQVRRLIRQMARENRTYVKWSDMWRGLHVAVAGSEVRRISTVKATGYFT